MGSKFTNGVPSRLERGAQHERPSRFELQVREKDLGLTSVNMKEKGFISEGDVALLLRRYTASTLLALLQEIYNAAESKLDWTSLAKNSNSGIGNARECQALWRHLAYRASLPDCFEDDMEVLDDDSDLELEVEPLPGVSPEVAANVAACVKVLAATGPTANSSLKNQEACFVIEIPNSSSGWEVRGNGQISNVVIQGGHTPETQPARKKRKLWTSEEDQELIAAVEKCGEGNWATMLKGAFKHERTAAQLSQRWALIRKRRDSQTGISQSNALETQVIATGSTTAGSHLPVETANASLTATDSQRASAPVGPTTGVGNTGMMLAGVSKSAPLPVSQDQNCSSGNTPSIPSLPQLTAKGRPPVKRAGVSGSQHGRSTNPIAGVVGSSSGQGTNGGVDLRSAKSVNAASISLPSSSAVPGRYNVSSGMRNNAVGTVGRVLPKSSAGPDPMVQAAAVAAGARIAPASAAASLLKAAQSGNVVHIGPGGVSMGKTGAQSQTSSNAATSTGKVTSGVGSRTTAGTLVHYIRTGSGSPQSLHLSSQRASQAKSQMVKSGSPQLAQSVRPNSVTLPSPGLSGVSSVMQKSHPPPFMSSLKAKAALPPVLPSESRVTTVVDAVTAKPSERIDGSSPSLPEGILKMTTQDLVGKTSTGPVENASGCIPIGQNVAGLSSQTAGPATNISSRKPELQSLDVVDATNVMVPNISTEAMGDIPVSLASTAINDGVNELSTKDGPQDDGPE